VTLNNFPVYSINFIGTTWRPNRQVCLCFLGKKRFGAVHKGRPHSGWEEGFLRTRGGLQMRMFALFDAKTSDFSKFMVCPQDNEGRGLSQCGHFADKNGGVNFLRFCADVRYGRPLYTIRSKKMGFSTQTLQKVSNFKML